MANARRVSGRKRRTEQARSGQNREAQNNLGLNPERLLKENTLVEDGIIEGVTPVVKDIPLTKIIIAGDAQYQIQARTLDDLQEKEAELLQRLHNDPNDNPLMDDPILNDYFDEWIARRVKTAAKPATPYRYRQFYKNHFRSGIGKKKITDIKRRDVLRLQTDLLEKVSPSTVNYLIQLLKLVLNDAVGDEIIPKNPAANVKRLKEVKDITATETNHRALTEEEAADFLNAAKSTYYYPFFAFLMLTGLRQGEGSAITWEDIDYQNNVLHIRRTLTYDDDGHVIIGPPKSKAGERDIPMNKNIRRILEVQKEQALERWGEEALGEDRTVFPSSIGGVMSNATANNAICRVLEKLERHGRHIDHFSCHALRDTFATRYIEKGGSPQTLKTILGHASLKMTMDLYAHVLPNTKQKEMDMIDIAV